MKKTEMKKFVFAYLTAFSTNGGLEKFNRAFMKALVEEFPESKVISLYDKESDVDERYLPKSHFVAAASHKITSTIKVLFYLLFNSSDVYLFGHINLAPLALLLKKLKPASKTGFIAHGIEVWGDLSNMQQKALEQSDMILAVSTYTKKRLVEDKDIEEHKIKVFHNTIDPFLEKPLSFSKPDYLMSRYNIKPSNKVLFTLCRLSAKEAYKGYDRVVEVLPSILEKHPEAIYVIAGKYDEVEKARVEEIALKHNVFDKVLFTGFLKDEEILDHYLMADLFVMPSKNEGFGIVFLEGMLCGLPVIAGNADGSVDALKNGELGTLVSPDDVIEIAEAVTDVLATSEHSTFDEKRKLQAKVIESFGYEKYRKQLGKLLK